MQLSFTPLLLWKEFACILCHLLVMGFGEFGKYVNFEICDLRKHKINK